MNELTEWQVIAARCLAEDYPPKDRAFLEEIRNLTEPPSELQTMNLFAFEVDARERRNRRKAERKRKLGL
jgi:hypothetical protein